MRGAIDDLPAGEVALIQMRDISAESGVDWPGAIKVVPPGKRLPDFLQLGDVVFTTRGVRNVAAVVDDVPGPGICAPNLFVIRLAKGAPCLPGYLAWYMNQRPAQSYLQRSATGSSILNIRREVVEMLAVPIPRLQEQEAIIELSNAARVERRLLHNLIKNRDQQLEALALGLAGSAEAGL
ncbi:restriction endonuclease subunit S [Asticcacaulis sp. YBE204]|uniref:restriction endonuclease subunit S n=1 Tax=Asticcacaulis sp. YBE204 TaxID=1282363 RepID=UPI0003C41209|nr:restriction endonuclease subunit S [Asticcacaulis sp. YBE204]ESQ79288.1 hypothetical protein AEYBE204_09775 [Asticcacaulis sp. YBE204]